MTIRYCPHCNQRYTVMEGTSDYIHDCNSNNLALDQEDVVVVGNWTDDNGATGTKSAQEVLRQGLGNELQGKRAQIEYHEDKEALTRRGVRASTRRQRQHSEFINLKEDGLS